MALVLDAEEAAPAAPRAAYLRVVPPLDLDEEPVVVVPPPAPSGVRLVEGLSREQRRSRRKRAVRARTESMTRLTKRDLEIGRILNPDTGERRPQTRGGCADVPRPCPFVSCKHNLFLDVSPTTGAIKLNFPDLQPDEMTESCSLDTADRGGTTLEDVGAILNVTRERIRQVETKALAKLEPGMRKHVDGDARGGDGKRRLPLLPPEFDDEDDDVAAVEEELAFSHLTPP